MLYSSIYNLFAMLGRKAPFTHSLTHYKKYVLGKIEELKFMGFISFTFAQ